MLRLELVGISKQYPAVKANDNVSLQVLPGEIHAVLGENGAGKSTMVKMIYGAVRPDEGEIRWNGERVEIRNPQQARALGISMVFQHFSLFDTLTAAENVWLGLDKSEKLPQITQRISQVSKEYGLDVEPLRPVHSLSVGERQRVEIVRALLTAPKLLILDEPTSVLTPQAVQKLFVTLRQLAADGCSILYISHKLDEIRALCHNCTVLRGGKVTGMVDPRTVDNAGLSRLMIGAEPPQLQHKAVDAGKVVMAVKGLSMAKLDQFGTTLSDISFDVRAGEIVGVAGVSGNGQQELMAALSGEDPRGAAGSIKLFDRDISAHSPRRRRKEGLNFVPEERLGRGAVPVMSLAQNTLLTRTGAVSRAGWIHIAAVDQLAAQSDRALQRQGRRHRRGGEEPVGRQSAEVHRRPRDRCRSEVADRQPAHLGRRCRRGGTDPRRTAEAARCRLRAADRQRGTRRAVRDRRPADRHRAGAHVAVDQDRRCQHRTHRRMDVGPVAQVG